MKFLVDMPLSPALAVWLRNFNEQQVTERLGRALAVVPHEELPSSIVVIEQNRIRRKRLPLEPTS